MAEEEMWKQMYYALEEAKTYPPTQHESELQASDGSFFEKFGFLLRQKSHLEESTSQTTLASFQKSHDDDDDENRLDVSDTVEDSWNEEETDNLQHYEEQIENESIEAKRNEETLIENAFGMNIEDLYEEILFEISNNIGCEHNNDSVENLIEFIQEVFKIPNEKHVKILEIAKEKEPPKIRLNVEVIKAENLMPKDANGLSDPFVTLYLESNGSHRYNSSVKPSTLSPIWEEHFSLPIAENPRNEILIVEIWDFDAAETVKEKMNKIFDVKGVKGLRKLMKEIAVTASTGKHDNEIIGRTGIPIKSIPVSGLTVWYNLEKGSKNRNRGAILLKLALSAEKNKRVALQEHRHLLKLLLVYELETSKVAPYWWNGKFDTKAETIREQHAVQSGLSNFENSLSQWIVYSSIHEDHALSFTLFNNLLDIIIPVLKSLPTNCDDLKSFWDGVKKILPSCFTVIRKLRSKNVSDKQIVKSLCEVLDIFAKINTLDFNIDTVLFPQNIYGWITKRENEEYCIDNVLVDAINAGTVEWLEYINEASMPSTTTKTDDDVLQHMMKLIHMIKVDLQKAIEFFDKHFYQKMRIQYSTVLFKFYDRKIFEITKSAVEEVCSHIKKLDVPDDQFEYIPNIDNINMGTALFELYLTLKRFLQLGKSLCPNESLMFEDFYISFMPGVAHWLDIAIIKALNRINKAIELDKLIAVDETVKYSSSAVDTLTIFHQIKIFWTQLDWPDLEGSYTFVAKIVDDICRCCIFYAQRMSRRVENLNTSQNDLFEVSTEWCLAINNIDYLRQSLKSFIKELGTEDLIKQLGDFRSVLEAERCNVTINNVVENALDIERNQILELIEIVAKKMAPPLKRFLAEGAEVLHEDSNSMEKLMMYLENSLATLYSNLNEVNFGRILDAIWTELSVIMYDLIQSNLDKRRPPAFFQNLRQTLRTMTSCFKVGNYVKSDVEILSTIERMLDLHAFETSDLIHQYYLERLGHQKDSSTSEYGQLTVRAKFTNNGLILNIINARDLLPMDPNGSTDSFVKVHFLPTTRFLGIAPVKTAVQSKTRFPLYDEEFIIKLSEEQQAKQNSLILFSIKDKDLFGMTNQYIAECYITFADFQIAEYEQIHLTLSRPEYIDSDTLRALELRQGDKQAKDFIKKLKNKSYS